MNYGSKFNTKDGKPIIRVKGNYTYVTDGFHAIRYLSEAGDADNSDKGDSVFNTFNDKYFEEDGRIERIPLPTAKELKEEIKRRQITRAGMYNSKKKFKGQPMEMYYLREWYAVNIFYLLDIIELCDSTEGYADTSTRGGAIVSPLWVKGEHVRGCVLPIRIKEAMINIEYPPEKGKDPIPHFKTMMQIRKNGSSTPLESYEDGMYYVMNGIVCVRMATEYGKDTAPCKEYAKYFKLLYRTVEVPLPTTKELDNIIKENGGAKAYTYHALTPDTVVSTKEFKRALTCCGKNAKAYWSGEKELRTYRDKPDAYFPKGYLFVRGDDAEAVMIMTKCLS